MAKRFFFDMDGTLSAPRYRTDNGMVIGFSEEEFNKFCETYGASAYDDCAPVGPVIEFAKKMKDEKHLCVVLTAASSAGEREAKLTWLERMGLFSPNWQDGPSVTGDVVQWRSDCNTLFSNVLFVPKIQDKVQAIRLYKGYFVEPADDLRDCVLVDDTFSALLDAHAAGIQAVHVSNILTNSVSC